MAIIGSFTKSENGFSGMVRSLSLKVKCEFRAAEKPNDKAPDYRIFSGQTEFGAAWKKTTNEGRTYLSVKLDDPSWGSPSTPRSSKPRTARATASSGPAATATDQSAPSLADGVSFCAITKRKSPDALCINGASKHTTLPGHLPQGESFSMRMIK
jgi:uncharacterized protein (DUF736 family)